MFVRALFILLLALNIGGACWLVFAPRAQPAAAAPATDPGVAPLVLLSERDGSRPDPPWSQPTAGERSSRSCTKGHLSGPQTRC